jgi:hypothetical protein
MTPARVASPLPECAGCGRPVRRDVAAANGGRCSDCVQAAVDLVLFRTPRHLALDDLTCGRCGYPEAVCPCLVDA